MHWFAVSWIFHGISQKHFPELSILTSHNNGLKFHIWNYIQLDNKLVLNDTDFNRKYLIKYKKVIRKKTCSFLGGRLNENYYTQQLLRQTLSEPKHRFIIYGSEDDINSTGNISWKYLIKLMHYTEMHFFFIFPFFPQKLMGFQKSIAIFTRRTWIRIRSYVVLKMYILL